MRLPLSWLKDFVDFGKIKPQEIAETFTLLGHEVEKIEDFGKSLENIFVGHVLEVRKHPNADKLRLVQTRVGKRIYSIVCGGINLREGMAVALAMPGARVRWHGEGDLVELKETEIRGVKSVGMICASDEIGLNDLLPHKRGEVADLSTLGLKDGEPLASALMLDGPVFYLDITPNRPDCLSVLGLARELGAALHKNLESRIWNLAKIPNSKFQTLNSSIKINIQTKKLCPKYTVQLFTNVKVGESPLFIKSRLWAAGIRPINNVVDITNYVMLEMGEPMHAFDFDKLSKTQVRNPKPRTRASSVRGRSEIRNQCEIFVRNARKNEKISALDGNVYTLDEADLVIADAASPIAIAGVMGGEETGVSEATKNILLEAAIFDPVSVRKTSRRLNLRSESSARFERGVAWQLSELAQERARKLIEQMANGKWQMANNVSTPAPKSVSISQKTSSINQMLNLRLAPEKLKSIFTALGFKWSGGENFKVIHPWWRLDIKIPEDLCEEVGRIYGLNKLSPTSLHGELKLAPQNPMLGLSEAVKNVLLSLGFDEVYTYSFYGQEALSKDGSNIDREPHTIVENPINPNQEFLRVNLTRNLLEVASRNARTFDKVKIFEIGRVFLPDKNFSLPKEETHLAMVCVVKGVSDEDLFRQFRGDIEALIGKQVKPEFQETKNGLDICFSETLVGWMGLLDEGQKLAWKIKEPCAIAEFNLDVALASEFYPLKYKALPEFPLALRDLSFTIDENIKYGEVENVLESVDPVISKIELFDIFRGSSIGEGKKSLALHLTLQAKDKTLSDSEIDVVMSKLTSILKDKFGAEVRS